MGVGREWDLWTGIQLDENESISRNVMFQQLSITWSFCQ